MVRFIGKHRVRANFYHVGSLIVLVVTLLTLFGNISNGVALFITTTIFVADYLAEMYDPNPDSPGPWFITHFHRAFDNEEE